MTNIANSCQNLKQHTKLLLTCNTIRKNPIC